MAQEPGTLKGLQNLDIAIYTAKKTVSDFDPLFEEVDEPVLRLESQTSTLQKRLGEVRAEERRLERAAEEKQARTKALKERLQSVRNLREEAAVHSEQDLLQRALEADEREALGLLDQIRIAEKDLAVLEASLAEAQAELEPKKAGLLADRDAARATLKTLEDERAAFAAGVPEKALSVYERIKSGGRKVVVADLTADGACGHCYSLVPLQTQHEVRKDVELLRCEGCGVILGKPDPVVEVPVEAVVAPPVAPEISEDDASADESLADESAADVGEAGSEEE